MAHFFTSSPISSSVSSSSLLDPTSFTRFAQLLDAIQRDSKPAIKKRRLEKYITRFRQPNSPIDPFQVLRLILPHLDKDRATYGVKDKTLANLYIDVLSIRGSPDADRLIQWRRPVGGGRVAGDFGEVLFEVLRDRTVGGTLGGSSSGRSGSSTGGTPAPGSGSSHGMSAGASSAGGAFLDLNMVNQKLDELNTADSMDERKAVIQFFAVKCSAVEQKWLARIILKELKIGITEHSVFSIWHPEAEDLYNVSSSLSRVAHELRDLSVTLKTTDVILNHPFKPMLSKSAKTIGAVERLMKHKTFWIETKLDGERMQLHKDGDSYKWFSRNAKDYTHLYGENKDNKFATCIQACFSPAIKNCILDGELLSFIPETGEFEGFGALKTAANRLITDGEAAASRPCFVVFDIVYMNGRSLIDSPLCDRQALLIKAIKPRPTYLEILAHTEGNTTADVVEALDLRMLNHDEGIIIKNPDSAYGLNDRAGDWLKLKPDYIDQLGDDIDLLLVGGFFGTGRRSGRLSHFMCAVRDDSEDKSRVGGGPLLLTDGLTPGDIGSLANSQRPGGSSGPPIRFVTLCKFGSGYKLSEIETIAQESNGNWSSAPPTGSAPGSGRVRWPQWLAHPPDSKEKPDRVVIDPTRARVVTVKAAEIVKSEQYAAGLTLRFPRFVAVREDKSWDSVMTLSELDAYLQRNKGRMQSRKWLESSVADNDEDEDEDGGSGKRRRKALARLSLSAQRRIQKSAATVAYEYKTAEVNVKEDEIFKGMEICVIVGGVSLPDSVLESALGGSRSDGDQKHFVEKEILKHGGTCVQNPRAGKTQMVIADRTIVKVSNQIGKFDLIKSKWVFDSIKAKRRLEIQPRYVLFATDELQRLLKNSMDIFGDSFAEPHSVHSLKDLFANSQFVCEKRKADSQDLLIGGIVKRQQQLKHISEVEERYMADTIHESGSLGSLFRHVCVYLDTQETVYISKAMLSPGILSRLPSCIKLVNETDRNDVIKKVPEPRRLDYYRMNLLQIQIRCHGGQVAPVFGPWTTHVIVADPLTPGQKSTRTEPRRQDADAKGCDSQREELFLSILLQYPQRHERRPHLVSTSWVQQCIDRGFI